MNDTGAADTWRTLAEKALKGAPLETLGTPVPDGGRGLTHPQDPLAFPAPPSYAGRPVAGAWDVVQRVDRDEGAAAQACEDLANGASALALVLAGAPSAHGRGLTAETVEALDAALAGVRLDLCPLVLEAGAYGPEWLALLLALAERRGTTPRALHLRADPFAVRAATGFHREPAETAAALAAALDAFRARGLEGTAIAADGAVAAEAGASPVEELASALIHLHASVRLLDGAGVAPAEVLPRAALHLSASQEQIPTIAKLRAARALHRLYTEAYDLDLLARIHVTTLHRTLTASDPHTNLLRLAIAAFSAGTGGADAVTVLPFEDAAGGFARRMARNLQTILLEETHLAAMADPGAGSGTIEGYTDTIAEAAWRIFQEHADIAPEDLLTGPHPLAAGILAGAATADRERVIIGVTRHPPDEPVRAAEPAPPALVLARAHTPRGATFADLVAAAGDGATLADLAAATGAPRHSPDAPLAPTRASTPHED